MMGKMTERERLLLITGGLALGLLIIIIVTATSYRKALSGLDRKIASRQAQLLEIYQLRDSYVTLKQQKELRQQQETSAAGGSPLTFLETVASKTVGREKLVLLRPIPGATQGAINIESLELKLERVDLRDSMRVLWEIEKAQPPMWVDKLYLKQRFDDATLLDMSATVSTARSQ